MEHLRLRRAPLLLERRSSVDLLRQFNQLRLAIEPEAAALAAGNANAEERRAISDGLDRMIMAEQNPDSALEADITFHLAILRASGSPFFGQFRDIVSTALRASIPFTNGLTGHSADVAAHAAVLEAITRGEPAAARSAMKKIVSEALDLIEAVHNSGK